jgi:hypothetical protein
MQKNSLSDLNQELLSLIEKEKILQEEYKKIKKQLISVEDELIFNKIKKENLTEEIRTLKDKILGVYHE